MRTLHRIDVHHHLVPSFWADALPSHGGDPSGWATPSWDVNADLELMDELGIATAMLSLTAPGIVGWQGAEQVRIARQVNEFTAGVVRDRPQRFGNFLTLPLGNLDASLKELEYGFDTLEADGVVLLSNFDGVYPGDVCYEPLWSELDRRAAVVFVHPTMPKIERVPGLLGPVIDYPFDTTRAAMSIVAGGVLTRHTRLKIILSHAGGFMPYGAYRFPAGIAALQPHRSEDDILAEMKRFYFDTALSASPTALPCVLEFAAPGHVLFGSDIPYARSPRVRGFTEFLDRYDRYAPGQWEGINRNSAQPLFARLRHSSLPTALAE